MLQRFPSTEIVIVKSGVITGCGDYTVTARNPREQHVVKTNAFYTEPIGMLFLSKLKKLTDMSLYEFKSLYEIALHILIKLKIERILISLFLEPGEKL